MALITLADAKAHLRVDGSDDDADVQAKLNEASAIILDYLKWNTSPVMDDITAPDHVKAACKLVLGDLYAEREGGAPISPAVQALLVRSRDPAFA